MIRITKRHVPMSDQSVAFNVRVRDADSTDTGIDFCLITEHDADTFITKLEMAIKRHCPETVEKPCAIKHPVPGKLRGPYSELIACAWLLETGWEVFRNVADRGEIDLIAVVERDSVGSVLYRGVADHEIDW